jgi:hypothetical protein
MTGVTMYVRWYVNQNFTFLGGWEMEALTLAVFALLIVLLRISERTNNKLSKDIGAALGHPELD